MKLIVLGILCVVSLTGCISQKTAGVTDSGAPSTSTNSWQALKQKINELDKHEDPNSTQFTALELSTQQNAESMFCLKTNTGCHKAAMVYLCPELSAQTGESPYRCKWLMADDSIHVTEMKGYAPLRLEASQKDVHLRGDSSVVKHVILGEPLQMHNTGYKDVQTLSISGQKMIALPKVVHTTAHALMVFAQVPGSKWYVKYVWVVTGPKSK